MGSLSTASTRRGIFTFLPDARCDARRDARTGCRRSGSAGLTPASPTSGQGEGEAGAQAHPVALGLDAAPVRLHDPLADGQAQAGVPARLPELFPGPAPGELAEQVGQPLSAGMPRPWSDTETATCTPSCLARTRMTDSGDEWRAALVSRLTSTCTMRPLVRECTRGRSGGIVDFQAVFGPRRC